MATLSKNGIEIARYEKHITESDGVVRSAYISLRSNGWILQKNAIKYLNGARHDWGWKRRSKAKQTSDLGAVDRYFGRLGYVRQP